MKRVSRKTKAGIRVSWNCVNHIENKCGMKRESEDNIRSAFCTMMNKLAEFTGYILDGYIEDLEDQRDTSDLEEKLKNIRDEKHRLALLLSKGCGEPVLFRRKLIELEGEESVILGGMQDHETVMKINELKARVGIKATIRDYGIDEQDFLARLDDMVEQAFDDQCTGANPRYPLMSEMKQMYLNAYYGNRFQETAKPTEEDLQGLGKTDSVKDAYRKGKKA